MRIGVDQQLVVLHDTDVAGPEHQVAAAQAAQVLADIGRAAELRLHHVGVARRGDADGRQRQLDEAGTVDPDIGLATPKIRRVQEHFRQPDEIAQGPVIGR